MTVGKIVGTILVIICIISAFIGGNNYNKKEIDPYTNTFDSSKSKIETTYVHTIDSIKGKTTIITRIDSFYIVDSSQLVKYRADTSKLKIAFDSVFVRDSIDSNTSVGYSQIYNTLNVNSKFIRDSSKLITTNMQLGICTTGLTKLRIQGIALADTAKIISKFEYDRGVKDTKHEYFKNTIIISGISFLVGGLIGLAN